MPCKGKLCLVFIIPFLVFAFSACANANPDTFGYTTKGGGTADLAYTDSEYTIYDYIRGSKFTLSSAGSVSSMTAYIYSTSTLDGVARCAIYTDSSGPDEYIAGTQAEVVQSLFNGWKTFAFTYQPKLEAGTYWLVMWGHATGQPSTHIYCYFSTGTGDQGMYKQIDYSVDWPDPLTGETYGDRQYSIYATYTPAAWHNAESWNVQLNSNASWNTAETWNVKAVSGGRWYTVEVWNILINGNATWWDVETWTTEANTTIYWHDVETWNVSAYAAAWFDAETWTIQANGTLIWRDVESWSVYLHGGLAWWRDVETWTVESYGFFTGFAWLPGIQIQIPAFGTYVDFNETAYFSNFTFYYMQLDFTNIYMGNTYAPIPLLGVSIDNGNLTFLAIRQLGDSVVMFDIYAEQHERPTVVLVGFDKKPDVVTIDNTVREEYDGWYYDVGTHSIVVQYAFDMSPYTGSSRVAIYYTYYNWHDAESWGINTPWQPIESWELTINYYEAPYVPVAPLLPIMFIVGMVGLGSMFAGPIYTINKVHHGETFSGFKWGIVVTALGVSLFIAWLWSV